MLVLAHPPYLRRRVANPCDRLIDEAGASYYGTGRTAPLAASRKASPGTGL
jgi:hypothetical protein